MDAVLHSQHSNQSERGLLRSFVSLEHDCHVLDSVLGLVANLLLLAFDYTVRQLKLRVGQKCVLVVVAAVCFSSLRLMHFGVFLGRRRLLNVASYGGW